MHDKAILEALKKRKMDQAPNITIMLGGEMEMEKGPSEKMTDDLAPSSDMKMADKEGEDLEKFSLLSGLSDQDKEALMNSEPKSFMDKVKKAQLMRKA